MNRFKTFLFGVLAFIVVVGAVLGTHVCEERKYNAEAATLKAVIYSNMLASYQSHSKISARLAGNSVSSAKCVADLHATAEYDELTRCIKDASCASYLGKDWPEQSPELIDSSRKSFAYYGIGQECK